MGAFESVLIEEILQLLNNFYKSVVGTVTSSNIGKIAFLSNLLQVEVI